MSVVNGYFRVKQTENVVEEGMGCDRGVSGYGRRG